MAKAKAKTTTIKKDVVFEFGEHFIRVWRPDKRAKTTYSNGGSFMFMTPPGAIVDGQITAPDVLAATLLDELAKHGLTKIQDVVFTVPSSRVTMREVVLPFVKDARIKDIINTNASDYFPVDLSTYHVAHNVLGPVSETDNRLRIMVYAAPMALLEGYFKLAASAGFRIRTIDYAGNSQINIYREINVPGMNLFVFVNHNTSYLTFFNNDNLVLQRTLPFGGGTLIEDLQEEAPDLTYIEVFELLSDPERESKVYEHLSEEDVLQALSRLAAGTARSIDYFTSSYVDMPIDNIILMGPMGRLTRLKESIITATEHTTLYLDEVPEAIALLGKPAEALPFLDCVGATLKPLDLMPQRLTQTRKRASRQPSDSISMGVTTFISALLVAAALVAFSFMRLDEATLTYNELQWAHDDLLYVEEFYLHYTNALEVKDGFLIARDITATPNENLDAFITELEQKMPTEILLLSAAFSDAGVALNIEVPSKTDAARVLEQFSTFESLAGVSTSAITQNEETGVVSFSLNCVYVPIEPQVKPVTPMVESDEYYEDYEGGI